MSTGNDHMPDKDALIRFANSEKGKALLNQLNNSDPDKIRTAVEKASAGDVSGAMSILRMLLSTNEDNDPKGASHGK